MDKLITTPHDFIWRIKNPQDYWADSLKEVKYNVYVNGKKLGGFSGVNRTFDDDMYYVNYYDENNKCTYCVAYTNTEMILEPINNDFIKERVVELINQIGNSLDSPAYAEKVLTECGKEILQIVGNLEEQIEILKQK